MSYVLLGAQVLGNRKTFSYLADPDRWYLVGIFLSLLASSLSGLTNFAISAGIMCVKMLKRLPASIRRGDVVYSTGWRVLAGVIRFKVLPICKVV